MSSNLSVIIVEEQDGYLKAMIPGQSLAVYKMEYTALPALRGQDIVKNDFVTYILHKKNVTGVDEAYVGKSVNNINTRPLSHEDLSERWDHCYVITDEGSSKYYDGAVAEFFEDKLKEALEVSNKYFVYTQRTSKKALHDDSPKRMVCEGVLSQIKRVLEALGLSLDFSEAKDMGRLLSYSDEFAKYPDGIPVYYRDYYKQSFICGIYLPKGKRGENFVLFRGSVLCDDDDWAFGAKTQSRDDYPYYSYLIQEGYIKENVLTETLKMSISRAKTLAIGSSVGKGLFDNFICLNGRSLSDNLYKWGYKADKAKDKPEDKPEEKYDAAEDGDW